MIDESQKPTTDAYRNSPAWCACGRRFKAEGKDACAECLKKKPTEKKR